MSNHMSDNSSLEISFEAEELYFLAAQQAFRQATALRDEVLTEGHEYSLVELLLFAKVYDLGDEIDPNVDVSDFDETTEYLRGALDRFTLATTSVDVFTVMTLEAHINAAIACSRISNTKQKKFYRHSLKYKWLSAPQLIGPGQVFDPSKEPFQSFEKLIERRNGIVHTEGDGRVVILNDTATPDDYMTKKLTKAKSALDAACSMAAELAKALNIAAPAWVKGDMPEHYVVGNRL